MVYAIAAVIAVVLAIISGAICFRLGVSHRKRVAEAQIGSAEVEAKRLVEEAVKTAENKKRESLLSAKEEINRNRNEAEKELKERRGEISRQERRLQQKEESREKSLRTLLLLQYVSGRKTL